MKFEEINKVLGDFMFDSDKDTVVTCVVNGYKQVSYLWRTSATFSIDYDDSVVFVAAKVLSIQDSNFFPDEETRNFFEEASVKVCSSELIKDPVELFQMRKTGNGMVYWELELF